jgi:hypothetical protein
VQLVEGKVELILTPALEGFHESTFTASPSDVQRLWPTSPSAKAELECRGRLEGLARESPERSPRTKSRLWQEAKRQWPKLSERAFDRCWQRVVKRGASWNRAGRHKELPH